MEFPQVGTQCAVKSCKQNDFLPSSCAYCSEIFCKNHFTVGSHNCSKNPDKSISEPTERTKNFLCTQESCKSSSPVEMNCVKCKKHFCLIHRHHGCFDKSEEEIAEDLKNWNKPRQEFAAAKNAVDNEIKQNLKKSKNASMVAKLQLMKIKGRAFGSRAIPMADRKYFYVYAPQKPKKIQPLAVFVNNTWTVGKVIDTIAESFGLKNSNNTQNTVKLRIFHHDNGQLISDQMDALLSDLYDNGHLTDGQSIILEYSNEKSLDHTLYN